jgi:hypothetical protein
MHRTLTLVIIAIVGIAILLMIDHYRQCKQAGNADCGGCTHSLSQSR